MVLGLPWKQGNLFNPDPDEVGLNLFPDQLKDAILIDETPGFAKGQENDICSILLEKVGGSDLNQIKKRIL